MTCGAAPSLPDGRTADDGAIRLWLPDDAATERLGEDLVVVLKAGDVVALSGEIGAGKSTLARAMIRALADDPGLDVPSPTYTLVQVYDTEPALAHFDLYRLGDPAELGELGFGEAAEAGIVLCEWPERAPEAAARSDLLVRMAIDGAGRAAAITGTAEALARIRRTLAVRDFLGRAGKPAEGRRRLFGDASTRRYETLRYAGAPAILMDAPHRREEELPAGFLAYARTVHLATDVVPFVAVAHALRGAGFAAPEIHAADLSAGLVLLEHLGTDGLLDAAGRPVAERYEATALALASLHAVPWEAAMPVPGGAVHRVPPFDRAAMAAEVALLLDWYVPHRRGSAATAAERGDFETVWAGLFDALAEAETSLVLRDVHSPNVIWREGRCGLDRVGLIDFQDAMIGPAAYDLASLAQDARVDIAPELEMRLIAAYRAAREAAARAAGGAFDAAGFERAYAVMAAQRASKILGIFVRLDARDGKPHYLRHIPRLKTYLERTLGHPALAPLAALYRDWGLLADAAPAVRPPSAQTPAPAPATMDPAR